ncbi:MAG: biopolymer transporter ExbD [Planctomycetota bacterium]|nr:biopolymer transporter ExbD [Planctomycetota bacterium]
MQRRKRKKRSSDNVELNLAAMLDMAFQLLAFFILTFKPSPIEGDVNMRLPPPQPVVGAQSGLTVGSSDSADPLQALDSLVVTILGTPTGAIEAMAIGENQVPTLAVLESRIHQLLKDPGGGFQQVLLQVGPTLHYGELMKVVDICNRAKLPDNSNLSKLSFVELPTQ